MRVRYLGFAAILMLVAVRAIGQVSSGGIPESFSYTGKSVIPAYILPKLSNDSLIRRDQEIPAGQVKAFRFAEGFTVQIKPSSEGNWITMDNGDRVWRLSIHSAGAYSLGMVLEHYQPVPGGRIFLYSKDHTVIFGAFTSENLAPGGCLSVMPFPGSDVVIEYDLPRASGNQDPFVITTLAHDYKNFYSLAGSSGSCNLDVNCPQVANWHKEKNGVCKLLINSMELCSGVLINNTRNDGRPFVLTANHCISTDSIANRTLFIFNYEKDSCGSASIVSQSHTLSGSWLKATELNLDFTLVEMGERPPYSFTPYYVGWNVDTSGILNTVAIHHPEGDVKKISIDANPPTVSSFEAPYSANAFWKIGRWETGTTEPGSSGAPLFDQNHQVIGTLTGGQATCYYPVNDFFEMLSRAWNEYPDSSSQLKYWLDPDHSGLHQLTGMNPFPFYASNCVQSGNILATENTVNPEIPGAKGFYTGNNVFGFNLYAERFIPADTQRLTGVYFSIARLKAASMDSYLTLYFWKKALSPDSLVFSQKVMYTNLAVNATVFLPFNKLVVTKDTFFVGYQVNSQISDSIALYMAADRGLSGANTAYVFTGSAWQPFSAVTDYGWITSSLAMQVQSCDTVSSGIRPNVLLKTVSVYPNPGNEDFRVDLDHSVQEPVSLTVFNLAGQEVRVNMISQDMNGCRFSIPDANPGIYLLKIHSGQAVWVAKLLKL